MAVLSLVVAAFVPLGSDFKAQACSKPDNSAVATAFEQAAYGQVPPSYPHFSQSSGVHSIPPTLLKAVGWVESNWGQFTTDGRPEVSFDFGYGIMQITSGMAGAFGNVHGDLDPKTQSLIASDYRYNIAYGARMLADFFHRTPKIGNGDPTAIENWYYALWAYNGWGWVNNPNNPRFSRSATPATNQPAFPYQERVLYFVVHPPRDRNGRLLWRAIHVSLPKRSQIGRQAHPLPGFTKVHRELPKAISVTYHLTPLPPLQPSTNQQVTVQIRNTGRQALLARGPFATSLVYHVFNSSGDPFKPISPFSRGIVAFGQNPTALSRDLQPGKSISIRTLLRAPDKPGTYKIAWDLQRGISTWLSQTGILPGVETLRVLKAGQVPPPGTSTPLPRPQGKARLWVVASTSFPRGSVIGAGQTFRKGWLVFNSGQRAWTRSWSLRLISGSAFHAQLIAIPPTPTCRSANIIARLQAPDRRGSYQSVWRLQDPQHRVFGERLVLRVQVT